MTKARSNISAFATSLAAIALLLVLWHAVGAAESNYTRNSTMTSENGYPITAYFWECVGPGFVIAYVLASSTLGWAFRSAVAVGLGMLGPLPIGLIYEVAQDPTNHNLLPFEVALYWVPAFAIAFLAAALGARVRRPSPSARTAKPGSNAGA